MPFEYCSSLTFHSTSRSARSLFVLEFCGILEFEMLQTHIFYSVLKMDFLNWMLCLQKVDNTSFKWEGHLIFLHFSQMINSINNFKVFSTFALHVLGYYAPKVVFLWKCAWHNYILLNLLLLVFFIFHGIFIWKHNILSNCEMSCIFSKLEKENYKCVPCIKGPYFHAVPCKIEEKSTVVPYCLRWLWGSHEIVIWNTFVI